MLEALAAQSSCSQLIWWASTARACTNRRSAPTFPFARVERRTNRLSLLQTWRLTQNKSARFRKRCPQLSTSRYPSSRAFSTAVACARSSVRWGWKRKLWSITPISWISAVSLAYERTLPSSSRSCFPKSKLSYSSIIEPEQSCPKAQKVTPQLTLIS